MRGVGRLIQREKTSSGANAPLWVFCPIACVLRHEKMLALISIYQSGASERFRGVPILSSGECVAAHGGLRL
jgi:hypothetical protein